MARPIQAAHTAPAQYTPTRPDHLTLHVYMYIYIYMCILKQENADQKELVIDVLDKHVPEPICEAADSESEDYIFIYVYVHTCV